MPSPQEPERYSIDEMMERLKQRPEEEPLSSGQLVTRPDGSQVIKVRKRKRRSEQPQKEMMVARRRARIIQLSAAILLFLAVVFAAGLGIVYANSAPFREALVQKINRLTGGKVELNQFRVNPTSANAAQVTIAWPEGNILRELTGRSLSANIAPSTFLGKSFHAQDVFVAEATVSLRTPDPAAASKWPDHGPSGAGGIEFSSLTCPKLNVVLGEPAFPLARINGTEVSFSTANSRGVGQLLLNRGELVIPGWPKMPIDRSHVEFRGHEMDVVAMRFRPDSKSLGFLEISGTLNPYQTDQASHMSVVAKSFPLAGIVGADWGRLLAGQVDSRESTEQANILTLRTGGDAGCMLDLSFENSPASPFVISKFPFLFILAQVTGEDWFENPKFDSDVSGSLRLSQGQVEVSGLNLLSKNRLHLKGNLASTRDLKLAGSLRVGLADSIVATSKNRKLQALFGPAKDGFCWLELTVSGTVASPADNFRQLYEAATAAPAQPATAEERKPSFEDLTTPGNRR